MPDPGHKRYDIFIQSEVSDEDLESAERGTIGREGRYSEAFLIHKVNGKEYKTKITTLRGDVRQSRWQCCQSAPNVGEERLHSSLRRPP